jgi:hypothetical protein
MNVLGTKNLKAFAPCYSQSPPPADFTPPYVFLDLICLRQQLKVGGGLALFTLSLCLPVKVALIFLLLHFIYKYTSFPHKTTIRNASTGDKPDGKPYPPLWFQNSIQNNQPMNKLNN